ncbi:MAG: zinc-binding dehydrogenase [Anaerolineae bacterium]|nr:zinc-binding dehydrogenase [Anaerolineae bacterium]
MRASRIVAQGCVEFVEAPDPVLGPGQAIVRPVLLAICGSDVRTVYHRPEAEYPLRPGTSGHEMIGVIEAVDAPGKDLRPGDLALVLVPNEDAMAELYLASAHNVLVLPSGVPIEHLLMAQQLGTVIYASKRLPSLVDKDVVVIGQGSAGLFFDALCRRMGARRVIGLDVKEARVAAGLRIGATHTVNNAREDALGAVRDLTEGRLADLVIEAAGEAETINLAHRLVRTGGCLLYFGIPRVESLQFDFYTFFRKYCQTLSIADAATEPGRASFRLALDWIARGEIDVSFMPTHRFLWDNVTEAYALARSRDDGAIKVLVEMPQYRRRLAAC